jgi:hypothetical protein
MSHPLELSVDAYRKELDFLRNDNKGLREVLIRPVSIRKN